MPTAENYAIASASSASASDISASASAASEALVTASKLAVDVSVLLVDADASTASDKATEAASSAASALVYLNNIIASVSTVGGSESDAALHAANALISEQNAATSLSGALTAETNAGLSETASSLSETASAASAVLADTAKSDAEDLYDLFDDRMLGSKASAPTFDNDGNALLTGAMYWDSVLNGLFFWSGSAWENPNQTSDITGGSSSSTIKTITVKSDTSTNWGINDPILAKGEIGFEEDLGTFKIGDGSSLWSALAYPPVANTTVTGFENVDNTSDVDKPVSTLQASADTLIGTNANTYADGLILGLLNDRGNFNASVDIFPATGGSGLAGAILKGDVWDVSVAGTLSGIVVKPKDQLRALKDTPLDLISDWIILAGKDAEGDPYVMSTFSADRPLANFLLLFHTFSINVVFPVGLAGSEAHAKIAPYADTSLIIKKNEIAIGSVDFTAGSQSGTFTFLTETTFTPGDSIEIYTPGTVDITMKQFAITLKGLR